MTKCEICGEEIHEKDFQRHLIEVHGLLFTQYIGLVGSKMKNIIKSLIQ